MMVHTYTPVLGGLRQENHCELEARLPYIVRPCVPPRPPAPPKKGKWKRIVNYM